jgi:hypothetical protein
MWLRPAQVLAWLVAPSAFVVVLHSFSPTWVLSSVAAAVGTGSFYVVFLRPDLILDAGDTSNANHVARSKGNADRKHAWTFRDSILMSAFLGCFALCSSVTIALAVWILFERC